MNRHYGSQTRDRRPYTMATVFCQGGLSALFGHQAGPEEGRRHRYSADGHRRHTSDPQQKITGAAGTTRPSAQSAARWDRMDAPLTV
jgi:hypothetical protein